MSESQLGSSTSHDTGTVIANRYRLEKLIGHGGMASVYKAHDESLGRTVALKVFRSDVGNHEDVRRRREEMTTLAGLNHFGLVTLFDALSNEQPENEERAFLVMEYVEGDDLRTRLMSGPLEPHSVALIGADIADALAYVHERGIVHRDVKPGNILLPAATETHTSAHAKLADFGIARVIDGTRITVTGSVLGTASYLSPEQAAGGALGPGSDVYSLGLVLLESLTGSRVFPGTGLESAAARLARDPAVPPSLGPAWQQLLRWMTRRDADDRPRASEVAERLRALAADPPHTLDHTRVQTGSPNRTTAVLDSGPGQEPSPAAPELEADAGTAAAAGSRRKWVAAVMGLGAAATLAAAAILGLLSDEPHPTELPVQDYPSVDGDLGDHLEQLQRSVEP